MPEVSDVLTEEYDRITAQAIIAAKVANAEAKGHELSAQAFFDVAIAFKTEWDAAIEVVIEQAREIDRLAARVAAAERVVQAAREVADDEAKCRYDHNDFCQAHYSSRPCREEVLRDALAAWEAGK